MKRLLLLATGLLVGLAPAVPLKLGSATPELKGMQVQNLSFAPGEQVRLVHEATDRARRTWLHVVDVRDGAPAGQLVPGARSARVEALGGAKDRSDGAVTWWDNGGFFFVRALSGVVTLQYFDGMLRDAGEGPGRPLSVLPMAGPRLLAVLEDSGGPDLFSVDGSMLAASARRLTRTRDEVEHSLVALPDGRAAFLAASREETRLLVLTGESLYAVRLGASWELLSLAAAPGGLVAWARRPGAESASLLFVDPDTNRSRVLLEGGFLPPGLAPRPAVDPAGAVYAVRADVEAGNPVVRVPLDGGEPQVVALPTRGHQEVAFARYPHRADGAPWIAVVAVGGAADDVANHVWLGPLASGSAP